MARSSYIYLMVAPNGAVLGAFTVKRELILVGRHVDTGHIGSAWPERIKVLRVRDGVYGAGREPVVMGTLREVLDAADT
jgi:hypothetical protein